MATEKMTDDQLKALVKHNIQDSLGYSGDELSASRKQALDYYHGRKFGDEQEGRSQVISRDVAEVVEWIMPSLLRVFLADDYVRFDAVGAEDEPQAEQETGYVNHVVMHENPGFVQMHDWFKDGLLSKTGIATWWWDKRKVIRFEKYTGLTREEYDAILSEEGVEAVEEEERQEEVPEQPQMELPMAPPMGGPGMPQQMGQGGMPGQMMAPPDPMQYPPDSDGAMKPTQTVYDCLIKYEKEEGCEKWIAIPPEDFLIERGAQDIENCGFAGHSMLLSKSDLRSMGIDEDKLDEIVFSKTAEDDASGTRQSESDARDRYSETEDGADTQSMIDEASQKVRVYFLTLRVDFDGDGYSELRKIIYCQDAVLENDYTDEIRYADLCPIRTPHRFFGQSEADLVMDIQRIKSALWRQTLDNIYLANNPQKEVVADQVNLDDLLTPRVGGIVRSKQIGSIAPIQVPVFVQDSLGLIQYTDTVRENRTGVSRFSQGLEPDALKSNAGVENIAGLRQEAQQRIEMIARMFAETGVKRLMKGVHADLLRNQKKGAIIKLRNKYVPVSPTEWRERKNMTVSVGLGTGNKDVMLAGLGAIGATQSNAMQMQSRVVQEQNLYNYGVRQAELLGFKDADKFYTDPSKLPPPQPPPNPLEIEAKTAIQIAQMNQQGDAQKTTMVEQGKKAIMESDRQEAQQKHAREMAKMQSDAALEREKIASNERIAIRTAEINRQTALDVARIKEEGENKRAAKDHEIDRQMIEAGKQNGSGDSAAA